MSKIRAVPPACAAPHRAALESLRSDLKATFLERDDVVDGLLLALLCRQHVLLLGQPGTAKSQLVSALTDAIQGARPFTWLLTKFTTPEEIFGPISLKALQRDRFTRITTGKLPEAEVVFLDEVFKANSAILNSLLSVVNERVFHNDGQPVSCPLMTMVGCSNELPDGDDLEALYDRFLIRFDVRYLADARNVRRLLGHRQPKPKATMTIDDLAQCHADLRQVQIPDVIIDALIEIKHRTEEQGLRSSDRRWKQVVDVLRARAFLEGEDVVGEDHLDSLADVLWRDPKDRSALAAVVGSVGNPLNVRATEIWDAAREAVGTLGKVDATDSAAKAEWLRSASLIESRLTAMEKELTDLVQQNPKRKLRRVREVGAAIQDMKADVTKRVAATYGL